MAWWDLQSRPDNMDIRHMTAGAGPSTTICLSRVPEDGRRRQTPRGVRQREYLYLGRWRMRSSYQAGSRRDCHTETSSAILYERRHHHYAILSYIYACSAQQQHHGGGDVWRCGWAVRWDARRNVNNAGG